MGISFQVRHHLLGGCGTAVRLAHGPVQSRRAPKYCKFHSSPTEKGYLSIVPSLCLSSIPFVAAMGAGRLPARSMAGKKQGHPVGVELEKRSPYPKNRFWTPMKKRLSRKNSFFCKIVGPTEATLYGCGGGRAGIILYFGFIAKHLCVFTPGVSQYHAFD